MQRKLLGQRQGESADCVLCVHSLLTLLAPKLLMYVRSLALLTQAVRSSVPSSLELGSQRLNAGGGETGAHLFDC